MPTIRFGRRNAPAPTVGEQVSRNLTFFGMVGAVMTALHLKDKWDDYKQVPSDEEEGLIGNRNVALPTTPLADDDDEDDITLHGAESIIDTGLPARPKRKRSKGCCVCCGINCGLFWKAVGIVLAIFLAWNAFKLIKWAVTPSPTGLEGMPAYSSSLGCVDAPYLYDTTQTSFEIAPDTNGQHELATRGIAVGTIVIAAGDEDSQNVKYEMTLRSDNKTRASMFHLNYPEDATPVRSRLRVSTSDAHVSASSCMRYDIKMYVPPTLKKLDIQARSTTQVKFDDATSLSLEALHVTLSTLDNKNMILPNENVHAGMLGLQTNRGWIVGDVALADSATIDTQVGDAATNVRVHPIPVDGSLVAKFSTATGLGRTDIVYVSDKGAPHRPIDSSHIASRNGDMYLTYKEAEYNGFIDMHAGSWSARNVQGKIGGAIPGAGVPVSGDDERAYVGDKAGGDKLSIKSKGWVGLYF